MKGMCRYRALSRRTLNSMARSTSPDLSMDVRLNKAIVYQEPVDSLTATVHYNSRFLEIPSFAVSGPAGKLTLSGRYEHDADLYHGVLSVHVPESEFQIGKGETCAVRRTGNCRYFTVGREPERHGLR